MPVTDALLAATAASYGDKTKRLVFKPRRTNQMARLQIAGLPVGITSKHRDGVRDTVVFADYAMICLTRLETGRSHSRLYTGVSPMVWVKDMVSPRDQYGQQRKCRVFPDYGDSWRPRDADKIRAQSVAFGPTLADGRDSLFACMNGDGRVFVYNEPVMPDPKIQLELVRVQPLTDCMIMGMFYFPDWQMLFTIEVDFAELGSNPSAPWSLNTYKWNHTSRAFLQRLFKSSLPPWTYGPAFRPNDYVPWYAADVRSARTPGIYRGDELKIAFPKGIGANGLTFLGNGGALATSYGESSKGLNSALGQPSELIWIPPDMLNYR